MSGDEPRWLRFLKQSGEAAKSIQAIVGLVVVVVAAGGALALFGGDDKKVKPAASIQVEGRSAPNRTLAAQLERADNRTELTEPEADRSTYGDIYGDVHDVKVTFRGHKEPCHITWTLFNAGTKEELAAPKLVKPSEECRAEEESSFHQDVWVPNPDHVESYFVRFFLLDADGMEVERAQTRDYDVAF